MPDTAHSVHCDQITGPDPKASALPFVARETSAACPIRGGAGATVRLGHPLFEHNGNLPQITVQIFSQCSISNSHNYE